MNIGFRLPQCLLEIAGASACGQMAACVHHGNTVDMFYCKQAMRIALVVFGIAFGMAQSSYAEYPTADATIRESLANVQQRYRSRLDYHGWTELYYGETRGICNLQLNMPGVAAPLAILYFRSNDTIQFPQIMPKGLAQQLIADRMLIDMYQKSLTGSSVNVQGNSHPLPQESKSDQAVRFNKFLAENKHLGMAEAVSAYSVRTGLSKNTIRNLIAYGKDPSKLSFDAREQWKKGSDYKEQERKARYEKAANEVSLADATKHLRDDGDAKAFMRLRNRVQRGEALDGIDQKTYDKYVEQIGRKVEIAKRTAYKPLNEPYKPTKEEQAAIDECDRESARLVREQKKWYEEQKKANSRKRR